MVAFLQSEYGLEAFTEPDNIVGLPNAKTATIPAPSTSTYGTHDQDANWQDQMDLCIAIGGDGTLLHATSLFPNKCPPMVGFSAGSLGFLMSFNPEHYHQVLRMVLNGQHALINHNRLSVYITPLDESPNESPKIRHPVRTLLNEVVVRRDATLVGICELQCKVDGQHLATFQGDGVIVSSATG